MLSKKVQTWSAFLFGKWFGLEWACCRGGALAALPKRPAQLRDGCTHFGFWRAEQSQRHSLEILDDCGEVEFVAGAR